MSLIHIAVTFKNSTPAFSEKSSSFADLAIAYMAAGLENRIKTSGVVPLLPKSTRYATRGALRASIRSKRLGHALYVVTAGEGSVAAAYAAAQEAGITHGHVMRKYSTPGTGPHWFQRGIDNIISHREEYIRAASNTAFGGKL